MNSGSLSSQGPKHLVAAPNNRSKIRPTPCGQWLLTHEHIMALPIGLDYSFRGPRVPHFAGHGRYHRRFQRLVGADANLRSNP